MSDTVSFADLDGQHAELLPARTVLSLFSAGNAGGTASDGAAGVGGVMVKVLGIPLGFGDSNGVGAAGGSADGR